MNNTDATRLFRHLPSINNACKFQLIGNLHCDNRTAYIKKCMWTSKYCGTKTDELISVIFCLKPRFYWMLIQSARISPPEELNVKNRVRQREINVIHILMSCNEMTNLFFGDKLHHPKKTCEKHRHFLPSTVGEIFIFRFYVVTKWRQWNAFCNYSPLRL